MASWDDFPVVAAPAPAAAPSPAPVAAPNSLAALMASTQPAAPAQDPWAAFPAVEPAAGDLPAPSGVVGSFFGAFAQDIVPSVATGVGGLAGGTVGLAAGPGGAIAGDIAGGMAAGTGARLLQNAILGEDTVEQMRRQYEANKRAHPIATGAGEFIAAIPSFLGGGPVGKGLTKGAERALTRGEHVVTAATAGARMGGSMATQMVATGQSGTETVGQDAIFILDNMARNSAALGVTGLIPGARTFLGAVLGKAPSDAAAMTVATAIYQKAVHGEDMDFEGMLKDTGSHLPAFMILNGVMHGSAMLKPIRVVRQGNDYIRDEQGVWHRKVIPTEAGDPILRPLDPWREKGLRDQLEADHQAYLKSPEGQAELTKAQEAVKQARLTEVDTKLLEVERDTTLTPEQQAAAREPLLKEKLDILAPETRDNIAPEEAAPVAENPVTENKPADTPAPESAPTTPPEPPKAPESPSAVPEIEAPPPTVEPPAPPRVADRNSPTGIKNEVVDAERVARGLPPLMQPAAQSFKQWWAAAMKRVDQDPLAGTKLVDEISAKPREVSAEETALLTHELLTREHTFDRAVDEVNAATEANRAEKVAQLDRAREAFDKASNATKSAGTEQGRAFVARQMMVNRDFSLANMERRVRAEANDGRPLDPNQAAWVKQKHAEIEAARQKHEAANAAESEAALKHYMEQELKSVRAELEATKAKLAEAEKQGKKAPAEKKPEVLKALVDRLSAAEEQAWKNIRADMGNTNATILLFNPARLGDYATIVASWTAKGIKGVADLTAKIVEQFGESFRPHVGEIIAASKPIYEREAVAVTKRDKRPVMDQVAANAKEGKAPVPRLVKELVRAELANGITDHNQVISNVRAKLEPHHPGITNRQVSDIYSGYGKVSFPSKDALDIKMRELHRVRQLTSAIEDAMAKKAPLKSGPQRDKVTQEIREMQKELTRVMRENGIEQSTAEAQLKSSLDAIKTRLKNTIEDLQKQIKTGEKTKKRPGVEYDAEAKALKAEVERLREVVAEMEGPATKTMEQRIKETTATLERSIAELERRIKAKDFSKRDTEPVLTARLQVLRDKRDALREQYNQMKGAELGKPAGPSPEVLLERATDAVKKSITDLEKRIAEWDLAPKERGSRTPQTHELQVLRDRRDELRKDLNEMRKFVEELATDPVEAQLARDIKAIKTRTAKLQDRIAKGDFAPPVKKDPLMSKEKEDALFEYEKAKAEFVRGVFETRLRNRTPAQKIFGYIQDTLNTSRAMLTSVDFSAVLRQGGFIVLGHPVRGAKGLIPMLKAFRSERAAFEVEQQIANRPNAKSGLYERAKLDITRSDATSLTKMEEAYMSRWVAKIPAALGGGILRGSERAYRTFLNKLRADSFDAMIEGLRRGPEPTLAEAQAIANYINTATGRGDLGKLNQAAVALNTVFFAPKLVASRFQLIMGAPLFKGTARTRMLVAGEYARFLAGVATVYAIGSMFQDDDDPTVSMDPRGSDFGKLRYGNTRVDPLAGLGQVTVLLGRLATGEKKKASGKVVDIRGDKVPYGSDDVFDVMSNFARSKFSPTFGAVVNVFAGKNVIGKPTDLGTEAVRMVVPMSFGEIAGAMEEQGMTGGAAASVLTIFGMGVQTYDPRKKPE
jgi:hypothetical protein